MMTYLLLTLMAAAPQTLPITDAYDRITASAVLLSPSTALTAAHAVGPEHTIVFLQCGKDSLVATVAKRGTLHDLAILALLTPCRAVTPVRLSEAQDDVKDGEDVTVPGFPKGVYEVQAMKAAGTHLFFVPAEHGFWDALILAGDIRPGNSGGPVISVRTGKLVGIISGFSTTMPGKPGTAVPLLAILRFLEVEQ